MNGIEPTSVGELQLYKVLQRANLLSYYEVFISQGGDDVQQLCEAGEDEFLEIMSLVGMASKPLHVRRFQKALQEWVTSPHIFQKSSNSTSKRNFFSNTQSSTSNEFSHRPHSVPTVSGNHKNRNFKPAVDQRSGTSPKQPLIEEAHKLQAIASQELDEKTAHLLAKFAVKEVEERFPQRCSFEQAVNRIKANKKRPHLIRTLEMTNVEARNKEIRRQSSLFPVHFADRFSNSPLSLFEMMCNEAAAHLCRLHPMLLVADRAERLEAAQAVVRKVEKETQKRQRSRLDFTNEGNFPSQADEIIAKLNEVEVKQNAFKQKIASAEASKNFVHLLEYQSELSRLKQEEQSLMRQKGKILTRSGMLNSDVTRRARKTNGPRNSNDVESLNLLKNQSRTSPASLDVESSLLADLARAHNVFDSNEIISQNDKHVTDEDNNLLDVGIKQELINSSLQGDEDDSNEAIPLMKKPKLES